MGMVEPGGDPDFPEKPFRAEHFGDPALEHLERDHPVVAEVAPEIDDGHSAVADLPLDRIAALKSRLKAVMQIEH